MTSDARAWQARQAHRAAQSAGEHAAQERRRRNELVKQLRGEDPRRWTYPALAAAVGCSPELVAAIVKGRA